MIPGSLIEVISPVYGLNPAPVAWDNTFRTGAQEDGWLVNRLDPCLYLVIDEHEDGEQYVSGINGGARR